MQIETKQVHLRINKPRTLDTTVHMTVHDCGHITHADLDLTAIEQLIDGLDEAIDQET